MIKILMVIDYEAASADSAIRLKKEVVSDTHRSIIFICATDDGAIDITVKRRCSGFKSYFGKAWEDQ